MRYTRHVHESKETATRGHTKYFRIERVTSRSPDRDAHQGPVPSLSLSLSLSASLESRSLAWMVAELNPGQCGGLLFLEFGREWDPFVPRALTNGSHDYFV